MPIPRPVRTNEEILRRVRYFEEWEHRRRREYFAVNRPLTLSLNHSLPIPQVQLEQIQDCCNKLTAIYYMTSGKLFDVMHSIYEQWFRSHNIDINFGKFVAKLIRLEILSDEQKVTGEDVIGFHKAWCEHVEILYHYVLQRIAKQERSSKFLLTDIIIMAHSESIKSSICTTSSNLFFVL